MPRRGRTREGDGELIHDRLPREAAPPRDCAHGIQSRSAEQAPARKTVGSPSPPSIAVAAVLASGSTWLVVESRQQPMPSRRAACLRSYPFFDGAGAGLTSFSVRPPHREAMVQRPHIQLPARHRSCQGRLPADRRPRRRAHAGVNARLPPRQAPDQPHRRAATAATPSTAARAASTATTSCADRKWRQLLGHIRCRAEELELF